MLLVLTSLLLINFNFQLVLRRGIFIYVVQLSQGIIKRLTKVIIQLFIESCLICLILIHLYQPQQTGILRFGILNRRKLNYVLRWVKPQLMLYGVHLVVQFLLLYHQRSFICLTQDKIDTRQFMSKRQIRIDLLHWL